MDSYLCTTCGTQFAESASPPPSCPICEDPRQFVPPGGQAWTTLDALRREHRTAWRCLEPGLHGIGIEPRFAIGQRALLVLSPGGNVLWDCVALLDDSTVQIIRALGGLSAIAISHPHYYATMVEWAQAFEAPVLLHADDRRWVQRPDERIRFWEGETLELHDRLTIIRCGGHFAGGSVLHWPAGAGGRGALLTGDIIQVVPDRRHVSFLRSYPNLVPLSPSAVERIVRAVAPHRYDRIYGAWWDLHIESSAREAVARSAERYLDAIRDRSGLDDAAPAADGEPSLRGVLETAVYVPDLDAAVKFYRDALGLELVKRSPGKHLFFRCGSDMILVFDADATSGPRSSVANTPIPAHGGRGTGHIAFSVAEAEIPAWRERLERHGLAVEADIAWPQGGRSLYVRDPGGNSVELATPRLWGLPEADAPDSSAGRAGA